MTIRENVAFSDPQIEEEEVIKALRTCGVYEDILAMPDQMETVLGERGVSLSGGQKQRIAMSRAFGHESSHFATKLTITLLKHLVATFGI